MRKLLLRLFLLLSSALAVVVVVVLVRTLTFTSRQVSVPPSPAFLEPKDEVAARLAGALRFPTVSHPDPTRDDTEAFTAFRSYLKATFPEVQRQLTREIIAERSLLYTWAGQDARKPPILLLAHMDVVPVDDERAWSHPPFSGAIDDGAVWGRGALDDKAALMAILEAIESLLKSGFRPGRTLLLASGHDEEVGGPRGARAIAAHLRERGVRPEWLLDEGGVIAQSIVPGVKLPVALVGIAEKGFMNVELVVEQSGGHSSMPPRQTAIGILSAALARLEAHPMPGGLDGVVRQTFEQLGPEMPFSSRMAFANLWLFRGLIEHQLAARPATDAVLRTTTAVTIVEGGVAANVLPARARAVVNFRVRPGDTIRTTLDHVRRTIADPRVAIRLYDDASTEPSSISQTDSAGYAALSRTIREVFPGILVAPTLTIAATDSRHYDDLAANVYRFHPILARPDDLERIHGANERIRVDDYKNCVRFYVRLIRNAAS